ncbi:MAG: hypothetical protein ACREMA_02570 [Longimicrobiales bacterium]
MTGARVIFAIGLFGVPLVLLWLGHALRKRPPRLRALFWGGTIGYCLAIVLTTVFSMLPPYHWSTGAVIRDLTVHWSMLVLTVVGAVIGAFRGNRSAAQGQISRPRSASRISG